MSQHVMTPLMSAGGTEDGIQDYSSGEVEGSSHVTNT